MPVLKTKYGFIINFNEVFECTGNNRREVMAVLFAKFLTG
jgi:hypothetical protein